MKTAQVSPKNIDEYIAGFPADVQQVLEQIRATIREAAPAAEEAIKYQIPTFVLNENLVHFAAFKKPCGLLPDALGNREIQGRAVDLQGCERLGQISH